MWFPLEWEISTDLLVEFIASHTGIRPEQVGLRPDDDNHYHESGGVREWEDKGWSLWRITETEKQAIQRENQQLVRRVNQLEQRLEEARSGLDTSTMMESLLSQLEEAVSAMQGRTNLDSNSDSVMEDVDKTCGSSVQMTEECSAAGSE